MKRYYLPWAKNTIQSPFQRDAWAKGFAALLCKVGTFICSDVKLNAEAKRKAETKLRQTLEVNRLGDMPARVTEASSQEEKTMEEREADTITLDAQTSNDIRVSLKRLAAEAGLTASSQGIRKPAAGQASNSKPETGIVVHVDGQGVHVQWANGACSAHERDSLQPSPKTKTSSQ